MTTGLIILVGGMVILGGSALAALCWSFTDGQLRDLKQAPLTIFEEDEPVGTPTDKFPRRP